MDTTGAPCSTKCITRLVEIDAHYDQDMHGASQVLENRHSHVQVEDLKACVRHWAEVISDLNNGDKDKYPKRIVELLRAENFYLN